MGELRDRMHEDMRLAGYAEKTIKVYLAEARRFAKFHMRSPAEMGEAEIRSYLLHRVDEDRIAQGVYRQIRAALRILYTLTLRRPEVVACLPVRRKEVKLRVVLSRAEVAAILGQIRSLKYAVITMAQYGSGLRISESCSLRPEDIESDRMLMAVRDTKGGRDRYTILSERLLECLRDYWRSCDPRPRTGEWLFPGGTAAGHVSVDSARRVFNRAVAAAGIRKKVTPHVLRRSFSTHLVEAGVDLAVVKELLGHASTRTTEIYIQLSAKHLGTIRSPLDTLGPATPKTPNKPS